MCVSQIIFSTVDTTSDPAVPCYVAVDNCSDSVGVFNATIENCCVTHNALSYYNLYPADGTPASCQQCPGMTALDLTSNLPGHSYQQ